MKKLALVCLLMALLSGGGLWKLRGWEAQTEAQARQIHDQIEKSTAFLQGNFEAWTNAAAEDAFSTRQAEPAVPEEAELRAEFRSPEGIRYVSMSTQWDEAKLKQLHEELLRNRHGEEIYTLMQVTVLPEENEDYLGYQSDVAFQYNLSPRFSFFPTEAMCTFYLEGSSIVLASGDTRSTVEAQAGTLSHEYGHHYTKTYFLLNYGGVPDFNRPYARVRGLNSDNTFVGTSEKELYLSRHSETLVEIAAEDYVVLMGSPNALRDLGDYCDVRGYSQGKSGDLLCLSNVMPQENMNLPFATKVPGLAELFYEPLGESPPAYPQTGDMDLQFERRQEGFNLVGGYRSAVSYRITWNKTLGEDATYTLICMRPDGKFPEPIKTVHPGQSAEAEIGEIAVQNQNSVQFYTDGREKGTFRFMVVVNTPEGQVAVSEPIEKSF